MYVSDVHPRRTRQLSEFRRVRRSGLRRFVRLYEAADAQDREQNDGDVGIAVRSQLDFLVRCRSQLVPEFELRLLRAALASIVECKKRPFGPIAFAVGISGF